MSFRVNDLMDAPEQKANPPSPRRPHTITGEGIKILLIDASEASTFNELFCSLHTAAHVTEAKTLEEALINIKCTRPDAILITSGPLLHQLGGFLAYWIREHAGTVIISGKISPCDLGNFFANSLKLPWRVKKGAKKSSIYRLNAHDMGFERWRFEGLPEEYRMEVQTVKNAYRNESVYKDGTGNDAIVWAKEGSGYIGYVGDFADEYNQTMWVILRMVGFVPGPEDEVWKSEV